MKPLKCLMLLLFPLLFLSACTESYLTFEENLELGRMRKFYPRITSSDDSIMEKIVISGPDSAVNEATSKGDFRPLGLALGLHSGKDDAKIFGLECKEPVDINPLVFGCVPPPEFFFKMMYRYNESLYHHKNFPHKNDCKLIEWPAE